MHLLKMNTEAGLKQDLWQQHFLGMLEGTSSAIYSTYRIWNSCFRSRVGGRKLGLRWS